MKNGQQIFIHSVLLEVYCNIGHHIVDDRTINLGLYGENVGRESARKAGTL